MIDEHLLNEKAITTLLTEVERILKSQLITCVSSDPRQSQGLDPKPHAPFTPQSMFSAFRFKRFQQVPSMKAAT